MRIASFNLDNIIECQRRFFYILEWLLLWEITENKHLSKQETPEGYHTHILNGGKKQWEQS